MKKILISALISIALSNSAFAQTSTGTQQTQIQSLSQSLDYLNIRYQTLSKELGAITPNNPSYNSLKLELSKVQQEMVTVRTRLATLTNSTTTATGTATPTTTGTAITASTGNVISNDLSTVKIASNITDWCAVNTSYYKSNKQEILIKNKEATTMNMMLKYDNAVKTIDILQQTEPMKLRLDVDNKIEALRSSTPAREVKILSEFSNLMLSASVSVNQMAALQERISARKEAIPKEIEAQIQKLQSSLPQQLDALNKSLQDRKVTLDAQRKQELVNLEANFVKDQAALEKEMVALDTKVRASCDQQKTALMQPYQTTNSTASTSSLYK